MKQYILDHLLEAIISTLIVMIIIMAVIIASNREIKSVRGVVLSHSVTADRYGSRTFSTIVKTEDGYIQEVTDLNAYAVPVGGSVIIEVSRPLEIKFSK